MLVMWEEEEEEGGGRGAATLLHPCAETDAGDVKPARGREHFFFLFFFLFFFFWRRVQVARGKKRPRSSGISVPSGTIGNVTFKRPIQYLRLQINNRHGKKIEFLRVDSLSIYFSFYNVIKHFIYPNLFIYLQLLTCSICSVKLVLCNICVIAHFYRKL